MSSLTLQRFRTCYIRSLTYLSVVWRYCYLALYLNTCLSAINNFLPITTFILRCFSIHCQFSLEIIRLGLLSHSGCCSLTRLEAIIVMTNKKLSVNFKYFKTRGKKTAKQVASKTKINSQRHIQSVLKTPKITKV